MPKILISSEHQEMRLDRYLRACCAKTLPETLLQKMIRKGQVRINSKRVQASCRLKMGDAVYVPAFFTAASSTEVQKNTSLSSQQINKIRQSILYQDARLIVLNKPAGLAVQGGSKISICLDDMLPYLVDDDQGDTPKLVHRLDKDTSGVLLIAKTRQTARELTALFAQKAIKKYYLAILTGTPTAKQGIINQSLLKKDCGQGKEKMCLDAQGKEAISHYRLLANREDLSFSAVELVPITGRTHQLRVHMAALGHPIVGDAKYTNHSRLQHSEKKLCLHARRIVLPAPYKLDQTAPLPDHMQQLLVSMQPGNK